MNLIESKIMLETETFILDELSVQIQTNQPHTEYRISLMTEGDNKKKFKSDVQCKSDHTGLIDIDTQRLIWSMESPDQKERMFIKHTSSRLHFTIKIQDAEDRVVAEKSFSRVFQLDDIMKEEVNEDDVKGTLFYPEQKHDLPAIIILGGSDASVHESAAALLASEGYVVLALAYFGKQGLPKGIENIPLEYVDKAFQLLEDKSYVDQSKLGIIGHSRGSELALLYASKYPKVKAVIATAPSAVIFSGMRNLQPTSNPAWTYKGGPFEFFPVKNTFKDSLPFFRHMILRKPYSGIEAMKKNIEDEGKLNQYAIPVQDIKAPIMIFAGTDDHIQPAELFTKSMEKALTEHEFKEHNRYIYHEGAGHFSAYPSNLPNMPQTVADTSFMTFVFGGTKEANAKAAQQSWRETIEFLSKQFNMTT